MRLLEKIRSLFTPKSLSPRLAGIEISQSGIKAVELKDGAFGLVLWRHAHVPLPPSSYNKGDIINADLLAEALRTLRYTTDISEAHVALPDARIEYFKKDPRTIDRLLEVLDAAGIKTLSLEGEAHALARALLSGNEPGASLLVDIGKTTTKLYVVTSGTPQFTETLPLGGHALTLAVQKHLGVIETDAWRVKAEEGIDSADDQKMPRGELLSALSPIRDAIESVMRRWNLAPSSERPRVSGVILAGGNSSLRGFPMLLERELGVPVREGDVFARFASRDSWMPPFDRHESLMYGTAIGLALREHRS